MFTTNLLTANWYADFLKHVPDSKLFSLRAVLDAFPAVIGKLPVTILLALGGAFFGIIFAMIFALVKINRVRILYPIQAVFVSFLRGTPLLVQLMLTYYGIPLILKAINQSYGTAFNINAIPAELFAIVALAFNQTVVASRAKSENGGTTSTATKQAAKSSAPKSTTPAPASTTDSSSLFGDEDTTVDEDFDALFGDL